MSPSVSIVFQSMFTVLGSRNLKSLTGSFMRRAAPYKLFSSIYMSDLSLCPTPGNACSLLAVTMCLLQNANPPRILFSNNRYISGDGHNEIFRFIFSRLPTAQTAIWSCNVHRPNHSALGLMIENFHIHHTIGAHPFPSSVSYNHPDFGN